MIKSAEDKKWEAQHDLDMLVAAEEIKADKKRHAAAMAHRDEKMKRMAGLGIAKRTK